jgi:hypothetical protein
MSRLIHGFDPARDYSDDEFLRADGAGTRWMKLRKRAIDRLAACSRRAELSP